MCKVVINAPSHTTTLLLSSSQDPVPRVVLVGCEVELMGIHLTFDTFLDINLPVPATDIFLQISHLEFNKYSQIEYFEHHIHIITPSYNMNSSSPTNLLILTLSSTHLSLTR